MRPRVLQAPRNLWRDAVAGHAHDEELTQARVEKPLGRYARVATTENGRVGSLGPGEIGQRLAPESGAPRLPSEKPLIPLQQPRQRIIGGELDGFGRWCHRLRKGLFRCYWRQLFGSLHLALEIRFFLRLIS